MHEGQVFRRTEQHSKGCAGFSLAHKEHTKASVAETLAGRKLAELARTYMTNVASQSL